jgi:hypothetical protein
MGYQTLNLNNCFQDESFLREVFYENNIKRYIPAAKANFVHLYINNQDWGLYPSIQQLNKDFLKEWYFSNDGINWRADRPAGGPPGQPGWGSGTSALNYLGNDTALYQQYYTLKSNDVVQNPWDKLLHVTDVLENSPLALLQQELPLVLNIDRTLWFLACETAYSDDDSYIYKGEMDYYLYYEPETGLMTPHEFDGNSVMDPQKVTWSAFYNQTNANYPLMNRIYQIPEWKQRYLAHLRTILNHDFDPSFFNAAIDNYYLHIDSLVNADPKKLYTYAQFNSEKTILKNFMQNRRNHLFSNSEVSQPSPTFSLVEYRDTNQIAWNPPVHMTGTDVTAQVSFLTGLQQVRLWLSSSLTSPFSSVIMYDDGNHQDGASGDGKYGAHIPAYPAGTVIRFYIEAIAANSAQSVSFYPEGAEHDVFYYVVAPALANESDVVINELMASNTTTVTDNFGEYDDWVELYNAGTSAVDISGWFISDNPANLDKWEVPSGTVIPADGYLIFWADEDSSQGNNHMNFKLSGLGESLMLLNSGLLMVDSVNFGAQQTDKGYARVPNGSGPFVIQDPTYNANNAPNSIEENSGFSFSVFPNPTREVLYMNFSDNQDHFFTIYDASGREMMNGVARSGKCRLDIEDFPAGLFLIRTSDLLSYRFIKN